MKKPYRAPEVQSRLRERCLVDGCPNFEELTWSGTANGLCSAHRKRKQRGQPLDTPLGASTSSRTPTRRKLLEAALAFADAEPHQLASRTHTLLRLAKEYGSARRR